MPFAAKEDPLFTRSRRWINNLPRHTSTIKWLTSHRPSNSSADDTRYLCSFVNRTNRCFTYLCVYIRICLPMCPDHRRIFCDRAVAMENQCKKTFGKWYMWMQYTMDHNLNTYQCFFLFLILRWTFLFEFLKIFFCDQFVKMLLIRKRD